MANYVRGQSNPPDPRGGEPGNIGSGSIREVSDRKLPTRLDPRSLESGDRGRRDNGTNRYNMNDEMAEVQGQSALISGGSAWGFGSERDTDGDDAAQVVNSGAGTETQKGDEDGGY